MKARILGLFGILAAACGQNPSQSDLDGHYENSNSSLMSSYIGQQEVIPEYAESQGVIISLNLLTAFDKEDLVKSILDSGVRLYVMVPSNYRGSINSREFSELRRALRNDSTYLNRISLIPQKSAGYLTVWARDWAPLGAKDVTDSSIRLVDFNYYSNRVADDSTPSAMGEMYNVNRISVPVYNEGGNFMNTSDGHCAMTSRVTDANDHREVAGDMILNNEEIKSYYRDFAGCKKVTIFPRMPYEGTGHIDMWAKFMNDDSVIVSELRDETMELYRQPSNYSRASQIKTYLDARAAEFSKMGYKVVRIPMPAPEFTSDGIIIRSYTNSLLLNGKSIIPQYKLLNGTSPYIDSKYLASMEQETTSIYQSFGYQTQFIVTDRLIAAYGAVHCVTMQIPR